VKAEPLPVVPGILSRGSEIAWQSLQVCLKIVQN
jgi:hypothetical protein